MFIAGVDEAGRGPWAGCVVAAAVILPSEYDLPGLNDSKKLKAEKRTQLAYAIKEQALAYAVAEATVEEIDKLNILQATMLAMQRAIESLSVMPTLVKVDGNRCPQINVPCEAVVGGDGKFAEISAASILAKVERDQQMIALDEIYPEFGFASHKGYGTKRHFEALAKYGPTPIHRCSFTPVRKALEAIERANTPSPTFVEIY